MCGGDGIDSFDISELDPKFFETAPTLPKHKKNGICVMAWQGLREFKFPIGNS